MKPVETPFAIGKYPMTQLKRHGMIALFAQGQFHWEVVRILQRPAALIHGKPYPEREVYPPSEDWGTNGWTYNDIESANTKFKELSQ